MSLESKMKISLKNVRAVVTKSRLADADFVINPYIGCQHSCIYCYADFMKRFTGHANDKWGEFVDVKINAAKTITGKQVKNKKVLIGSVTDPYQPLESKYGVTQKILEKLSGLDLDVEILTKSDLVLRDIELLKKFKTLKVGVSLSSLNDGLSKETEPYSSSPSARIETIKRLHSNGIRAYVFVSPILPGITDFKEILEATEQFTDEYLFENLNIRANNRSKIFEFLKKFKPELIGLYESIQRDKSYWTELKGEITDVCTARGLKYKIYFDHQGERKK